jgi:hypothetical protein
MLVPGFGEVASVEGALIAAGGVVVFWAKAGTAPATANPSASTLNVVIRRPVVIAWVSFAYDCTSAAALTTYAAPDAGANLKNCDFL